MAYSEWTQRRGSVRCVLCPVTADWAGVHLPSHRTPHTASTRRYICMASSFQCSQRRPAYSERSHIRPFCYCGTVTHPPFLLLRYGHTSTLFAIAVRSHIHHFCYCGTVTHPPFMLLRYGHTSTLFAHHTVFQCCALCVCVCVFTTYCS